MSVLERMRRWVDGDGNIDSGNGSDAKSRPGRKADAFAVHVAQEIGQLMEQEMFSPPGGPANVPPRYILYLSNRLNRLWIGQKRKLLLTWLTTQISDRASQLTARQHPARALHVEIRIDATLAADQFRVQCLWSPTFVAANGKSADEEPQKIRTFSRAAG